MRIHRIKLENYRGVAATEIRFLTDGVTIVEGPNEVGTPSINERGSPGVSMGEF